MREERDSRIEIWKLIQLYAVEWRGMHHETALYPDFPEDWIIFEKPFDLYWELAIVQ